ncbi:hypothetical protein Rumeso_00688 [Rubellimicrobium mesophilum DSM 19309]|uniref:Uncharacterized protein n=1 Tax=Rubellimicrobium mesophilum DSM 19309 TaxID=442562 RepID=A0A017HTR8_9RHOB|nr:hypothetical protein [Rubellimicrobium mesophilum]EYD77730.1 hypothetical protein Rumeso_00688 [Rubellimicrobium mesophilum DSM 19309]
MKTLLVALAALAGSVTLASAETHFTSLSDVQHRDGIMELGTIRSEGDGMVQVYSYQAGEKGPMLGWEALHAGANPDIKVPLTSSTPFTTALAEIVLDGQVVATQRIRIEN